MQPAPTQPEESAHLSQVVTENPVINSPFDEPTLDFQFDDKGITNEIVEGRRIGSPQDARFYDSFLVVTPLVTIREKVERVRQS